jgi:hypothetical protein
MKPSPLAYLLSSAILLGGCGGAAPAKGSGARQVGRVSIRVNWPVTRTIPDTAVKIRLELVQSGQLLQVKEIPREETYAELSDVPIGPSELNAKALDAEGKTVASGRAVVDVKLGQTVQASMVLTAGDGSSFSFSGFDSSSGLSLVGDAAVTGGKLRLVSAGGWEAGAAWYPTAQPVSAGFETKFQFRISDPGGGGAEAGADGFAFVLQPTDATQLGESGQGLGYTGIPNSLAVEFDTYPNWDYDDPNNNHVAIQTRGEEPNSGDHSATLGISTEIPSQKDGNVHTVVIRYRDKRLSIFIDQMSTPCCEAQVDLETTLKLNSGNAFVGFTGATAASYENEDILNWTFTRTQ